jgi:hypothetical protein
MSLLEEQKKLARLVTERPAGRSDDTETFADPKEVEIFAESLFRKRLHEVEKLLPLTRAGLNAEFAVRFREFCPTFNPRSTGRHLEDALAFCRFLVAGLENTDPRRATVKFEAAKLSFFGHEKAFAVCVPSPSITSGRRVSFAIWLRIGSRVRFLMR